MIAKNNSLIKYRGQKYLINSVSSSNANWKLVRLLPEKALYSNVLGIQNRMLLLTLIFILLSLILSITTAYNITKPLKKLIATMNIVEKGDLSIRFKVKYKDEIGRLGRNFNQMIRKIDNLINTIYLSQIKKKEVELNALQAQINPHFIYNTLESIRMMAKLNDDNDTAKMALILGKLLRYSMNAGNKIVTIKDEIEHLDNYLILQNFRFKDKLHLVVNIDQALLERGR